MGIKEELKFAWYVMESCFWGRVSLSGGNVVEMLCWNETEVEIWLWLDIQWGYNLVFSGDKWEPLNNFEQAGNIIRFANVKEHFGGIHGELVRK